MTLLCAASAYIDSPSQDQPPNNDWQSVMNQQPHSVVSFPSQQPTAPELDSTLFLSDELVAEWPLDLGQGPIFDVWFGGASNAVNDSNQFRGMQQ